MKTRRVAKIKPEFQEKDIEWVVLEDDSEESGGVFLFLHQHLEDECLYDYWHETTKEAESSARQRWGILDGDWYDFAMDNCILRETQTDKKE